jgi:hypothetical protein
LIVNKTERQIYACIVPNYGKIAQLFHRKWQGFLPARVLVFDSFGDAATITETGAEKIDPDALPVSIPMNLEPQKNKDQIQNESTALSESRSVKNRRNRFTGVHRW